MTDKAREWTFFQGFRWPVPVSFAAAIAASRFEQGDVLYRDPAAYGEWSKPRSMGFDAIQVLAPTRSTRATLQEGDSDRRRSNWASEVRIELIDPRTGDAEERVLCQGQLVMALWKGEADWLSAEHDLPEFPRSARELQANLEQAAPVMARHAARRKLRSGCQFALVVDLASDASLTKAALVEDQLTSGGEIEIVDLLPAEAGIEAPDAYHPTLIVRVFTLADRALEVVESELRVCLYQGGSARMSRSQAEDPDTDPSTGDRFSVARHGLLVEL